MKITDPLASLKLHEDNLRQAAEDFDSVVKTRRRRVATFFRQIHQWQEYCGDEKIGEPFSATHKEIKLLEVEAEKKYLRAVKRGGAKKPRLHIYTLVIKQEEPKPLWIP